MRDSDLLKWVVEPLSDFLEPCGEVEGAGWSSCERCPRLVFIRGTQLEAYSSKIAHWTVYHS